MESMVPNKAAVPAPPSAAAARRPPPGLSAPPGFGGFSNAASAAVSPPLPPPAPQQQALLSTTAPMNVNAAGLMSPLAFMNNSSPQHQQHPTQATQVTGNLSNVRVGGGLLAPGAMVAPPPQPPMPSLLAAVPTQPPMMAALGGAAEALFPAVAPPPPPPASWWQNHEPPQPPQPQMQQHRSVMPQAGPDRLAPGAFGMSNAHVGGMGMGGGVAPSHVQAAPQPSPFLRTMNPFAQPQVAQQQPVSLPSLHRPATAPDMQSMPGMAFGGTGGANSVYHSGGFHRAPMATHPAPPTNVNTHGLVNVGGGRGDGGLDSTLSFLLSNRGVASSRSPDDVASSDALGSLLLPTTNATNNAPKLGGGLGGGGATDDSLLKFLFDPPTQPRQEQPPQQLQAHQLQTNTNGGGGNYNQGFGGLFPGVGGGIMQGQQQQQHQQPQYQQPQYQQQQPQQAAHYQYPRTNNPFVT